MNELDLHGHSPASALRRLARELHAARVRGARELVVITGRGWGNGRLEPVLRGHVETWLGGPEGSRHGVSRVERRPDGGSLRLELR